MSHLGPWPVAVVLSTACLISAVPAEAQRATCTASYDSRTALLDIESISVGSTRYQVQLLAESAGGTFQFTLRSATVVASSCYDPGTYASGVLTVPDVMADTTAYAVSMALVNGSSPMRFLLTSAERNLQLTPDAGFRVERASNPFASVSGSTTYLGYNDRTVGSGGTKYRTSSDGLTFSNPTLLTETDRSMDSRRVLMPDGRTWRIYEYDAARGVMTSKSSSDGRAFTSDSGTRYTPQSGDNGSIGVYDHYVAPDGALVMIYVGDLMGRNNLRMARSTDNGLTFTFLRSNILGDDDAGGGGSTFIDNKTILLANGRRRMFTMRAAEIHSFISTDGYTYTREPGVRLRVRDFAPLGTTIYSLNDPVAVRGSDGRYRVYVAASQSQTSDEGPGNTAWGIVSASWVE